MTSPSPADAATEPPFSAVVTLLAVARTWEDDFAMALKDLGLTTRKFGLLGHIRSTPGISFSDLARRSRVTVQTAHVAVRALVDDGLVADDTAQAGASSMLRVTDEGQRVAAEAAARLRALDARFTSGHEQLSEALRAEMQRMLARRGEAPPA